MKIIIALKILGYVGYAICMYKLLRIKTESINVLNLCVLITTCTTLIVTSVVLQLR